MKPNLIFYALTAFLLLLFSNYKAWGQAAPNPYYTISYSDSLQKEPSSDFIYNNVNFTNIYNKPIILDIGVSMQDGWHLLGSDQTTLILGPGESTILPLILSKMPGTLSQWLPVNIKVQLRYSPAAEQYVFYVKAKAKSDYYATSVDKSIDLRDYQESIPLKLFLKNKGNIANNMKISVSNNYLGLDKKIEFQIPPGKDTLYVYDLKIDKESWKNFDQEIIKIWVTDDSGARHFFTYSITKLRSKIKEHDAAYPTFPIDIRGGITTFGNQAIFYGGIKGAIKLSDSSSLSFFYLTRQYGYGVGFQPNQYNVTYNYKGWQIGIGQVNPDGTQPFYTFGQGLKLKHTWKNGDYISITGIKHYKTDSFLTTDLADFSAHYHIKSIIVDNNIGAVQDLKDKMNSYYETNNINVINKNGIGLMLTGGAGFNHYTLNGYSGGDTIGKSLGYTATFIKKFIKFNSTLLYNDQYFPGLVRGLQTQSHTLDFYHKSTFVGLFYQSSYYRINNTDSLYLNSPSILYNMSNYGIRAGWRGGNMSLMVGTGILTQIGTPNTPPHYQSFTLDYSYTKNLVNIQFSSLVGINDIVGQYNQNTTGTQSKDGIAIMTGRAAFNMKYGGFMAFYTRIPTQYSTSGALVETPYVETFDYGPYLNYRFFHKTLAVRVQYTQDIISGAAPYSSIIGSFVYENVYKQFGVSLSGTRQLNNGENNQSYSLLFHKTLNVPVINHRKYYDLNVVTFNDENNNGILDSGETTLKNVLMYINKQPFNTDKNGRAIYANVEKGIYKIDFGTGRGVKGLMPTAGNVQVVNVAGNTTAYIPFKKGKLISGKVVFHVDSAVGANLTPDNIKVIVIDTSGKIYTTLTDENGEYFFNLPSDIYKVSLDPDAFDETIKPKQMSYMVNLMDNQEAQVIFEIDKKLRMVKVMNVAL